MPNRCGRCARVRTSVGQIRVSHDVKLIVKMLKDRFGLSSEQEAFEVLVRVLVELLKHRTVREYLKSKYPEVGKYLLSEGYVDMYCLKVEFGRVHIYGLGHLLSKVCEVTLNDFVLLVQMWADEHVKLLNRLDRVGKAHGLEYLRSYVETVLPYAEKIRRDASTFAKVMYYGAPCRSKLWSVVDEREYRGERTVLRIVCEICGSELETTDPWKVYEHFCIREWNNVKKYLMELFVQ